jgi:hypothetical protein
MLIPNERKPPEERSSETKPRKRWCGAMAASLYDSTIALMTHLHGLYDSTTVGQKALPEESNEPPLLRGLC